MKVGYKYEIKGLVQGVGFRPWLYSLAIKFDLFGEVFNDDEGVKLTIYGEKSNIDKFEKSIKNDIPPLARIDQISRKECEKIFNEFKIIKSKSAAKSSPILPDFAICNDCIAEFNDPKNSRYEYPFINCTNCGPRFSIIKSLPYDRINTTMDKFIMCKNCEDEYTNPINRRYHAQPISCQNCGPELILLDSNKKQILKGNDCIKQTANLIKDGNIIAIKGLGGFHLVCDACNDEALKKLRERKKRPKKPFAVMVHDIDMALEYAQISEDEAKLLNSNLKPIVLLKNRQNTKISPLISCGLNSIGIMIAYTGLHLGLFKFIKNPIVATSANISGEPILTNCNEVFDKLGHIVDFVLDFNRDIYSPSDDSIAFVANSQIHYIRTSRGLNPKFIPTDFKTNKTYLALGSELKNAFAIFKDGQIIISPYIGDLKNVSTMHRFEKLIDLFKNTYELRFDKVIGDLHKHFINYKWAKNQGYDVEQIQHHKAHLLAVMLENNLNTNKNYLGFCFDGTGLSEDGLSIWGGEIFEIKSQNGIPSFKRIYYFDEFMLLGGEASIKHISHIAFSLIKKYNLESKAKKFLKNFNNFKMQALNTLYKNGTNSPKTSSLGRIFDAMASIIFNLNDIEFEAQSGMMIEALYNQNLDITYEFKIKSNGAIDFRQSLIGALTHTPQEACTGFINGIADLILKLSKECREEVIFSGGVFQNATLLRRILSNFDTHNIKSYSCKNLCNNDSNIAAGQLLYLLLENNIQKG